ncbi:hypothetical protein AB1Y20_007624 [Prymnesium parvum]|uniref:Uncharacterized protein n=1 Tax=Prymnesium parvum TaxID=97485 RepID=A0AB34IVK5_PRYPA
MDSEASASGASSARSTENRLAKHINFHCLQCGSKLHLTSFPRLTDFVLACPCCCRKAQYNLHTLLDEALESAARTGSLTELSAALQLGADVDVRVNWKGFEMSPAAVTVAARKPQRYALLRRLIDEKADLDVHDHRDRTLLMNAIYHDDGKLFRLLIEGGANPHMPSDYGCRMFPIHAVFVTKRHHPNLDILQTLLDLGCSPQAVDGQGNPVLKYAAQSGDHISMALIMRALNWHLHAPDCLRPRKLADLLHSSHPSPRHKPPPFTHDLAHPPPAHRPSASSAEAEDEPATATPLGKRPSPRADQSLEHLRGVWEGTGESTGDNSLSSPSSSDAPPVNHASGRALTEYMTLEAAGELSPREQSSPTGPPSPQGSCGSAAIDEMDDDADAPMGVHASDAPSPPCDRPPLRCTADASVQRQPCADGAAFQQHTPPRKRTKPGYAANGGGKAASSSEDRNS